jgi:hypothetical protein
MLSVASDALDRHHVPADFATLISAECRQHLLGCGVAKRVGINGVIHQGRPQTRHQKEPQVRGIS